MFDDICKSDEMSGFLLPGPDLAKESYAMPKSRMMACKIRHFIALVISVGVSSLIFCMYSRDQPVNFQQFVTQTHKQFESLKENLQVGNNDKKLEVEDKYLSMLGFSKSDDASSMSLNGHLDLGSQAASLRKSATTQEVDFSKRNGTLPVVIISSVTSGQLGQIVDFVKNVQMILPMNSLVLWCLDTAIPSSQESDFSLAMRNLCNSSKCTVEKFNFEDYPDHVKDLAIRAYRPLIIQSMLDRGGCVLWLDIERRLLPFSKEAMNEFLSIGESQGLVAWSAGHPTSTLAHPKMISYFQTNVENYYFHRMIDPAEFLVCNTQQILSKVMLPWVKCSLITKCISPVGAQSSGCRFDKKPLFRYSGCHGYDSAALNLALGMAFPLHQPYIARAPISTPALLIPVLNQTSTAV